MGLRVLTQARSTVSLGRRAKHKVLMEKTNLGTVSVQMMFARQNPFYSGKGVDGQYSQVLRGSPRLSLPSPRSRPEIGDEE